MIQRKTQSPEYWQTLALDSQDVEYLRNLLLESEGPLTTQELALAYVRERLRREESDIRNELSKGALYQPKNRYNVGDALLFPALDFRLGTVSAIRPGQNPEYGEFDVMTVDFGPERRPRTFAAALSAPHKLNASAPELLAQPSGESPEKILEMAARSLPARLAEQLAAQPGLATFEGRWLLRDLLAEVHVGHLNIAEALIEMQKQPVLTTVLVKDMDLPGEIQPEILAFSVQSALAADPRFDQVGAGSERAWFLRRLEPPEALEIPVPLRYTPVSYDRDAMTVELMQLEWELDDEWTEGSQNVQSPRGAVPSTTILLTYPHLVSGTLPITSHSRPFFPGGSGERSVVTLIDGRWQQHFTVWAVHGGRYVAGLRHWYEEHKLPAGAFITLERRGDAGETLIDFRPRRMRRDWTRVVEVAEGRLDLQLRKQAISCEYDEQVVLGIEHPEQVAALRNDPYYRGLSLGELVYQVFVDLAGQSQQGTVHAKTVYSAVNVLRRLPPGPIFAAMAADARLQSIGDGFYRLAGE